MKVPQTLQSNDFADLPGMQSMNGNSLDHLKEGNTAEEGMPSGARRLRCWLGMALQSSEIGLWEWDIATGRFDVSPDWAQSVGLVGIVPRTLDGWLDLVHPEDGPAWARFVAAFTLGHAMCGQVEFRLQRPDGLCGWYACRGKALGEGHAIGVLLDVTAKRETLTRMHQVERLETIGQLTGGLAHDFNNLLTVIQGSIELLTDNLGGDTLNAPIIEEISTVVDRGAALTRRLLSFARHEGSATSHVDPDMMIAGLLPLLSHTLGGSVALQTDLTAEGWTIDVDSRQFENAIINLAINGRDAMSGGGTLSLTTRTVRLRSGDVSAERGEKPGAHVMVAVADTGQGMPPEVLARVFEPFFTTKAEKGTGLGIPMVARFVRQAGGHIRIDSVVGAGTTMRLFFPKSVAAN